jgi:hypothetical protein
MSWTYDSSLSHNPVSESEPEYDSVDIFMSDSPFDYTRLTRKELIQDARTIAEVQTYLEKRKSNREIYDYRINRPAFKINYN